MKKENEEKSCFYINAFEVSKKRFSDRDTEYQE